MLWPDRASMRPSRRVPDGLQEKVMRPRDHARAGVAEREIANLAHTEAPRIPEPCPVEKCSLQRCSDRGYRRAPLRRPANSAFTASLTAEGAGHHPTDDEADDSIPDDLGFPNNLRPSRGKILKRLQPVLDARRARTPMRRRKSCLSLGGGCRGLSRRHLRACLQPTLRLPVAVTGNRLQCTGDSIHGLNQRRQASQVSRRPCAAVANQYIAPHRRASGNKIRHPQQGLVSLRPALRLPVTDCSAPVLGARCARTPTRRRKSCLSFGEVAAGYHADTLGLSRPAL